MIIKLYFVVIIAADKSCIARVVFEEL